MEISQTRIASMVFVVIKGRMDSMNAPRLQDVLRQELEDLRGPLLLDLTDVTYLSAAGLRLLRMVHDETGMVRLVNPSNRVREVMQITGLDAHYKVYESRTEAIHTIRPVTNAHTQLELGWLAPRCPELTGMPFVDWLGNILDHQLQQQGDNWQPIFDRAVNQGIAALKANGTTVVADWSVRGRSIEPLFASGLQGVIYLEVRGADPTRAEVTLRQVRETINAWRRKAPKGMRLGLGLHAPYTVDSTLWAQTIAYARSEKLPLAIRVAQSAAESEYMKHGTGPLKEQYFKKRTTVPSPGKSPIAYLEDTGALALKPTLIHPIHVDTEDLRRIQAAGCTVVHCPRSEMRLRCGRFPLEKYLAHEVPVLLGTASLGSAPTLDIFEEAEMAAALHYDALTPERVIGRVHDLLPGMNAS